MHMPVNIICFTLLFIFCVFDCLDIQRKKLIDDLNSYGFHFHYDTLGLDKLRTLYYGREMYSKNQNG